MVLGVFLVSVLVVWGVLLGVRVAGVAGQVLELFGVPVLVLFEP